MVTRLQFLVLPALAVALAVSALVLGLSQSQQHPTSPIANAFEYGTYGSSDTSAASAILADPNLAG